VEADKNRLSQVMSNLLGNAIKFTKEGTITVKVEIRDSKALVTIKDTGQGIDPEIIPGYFQSLSQSLILVSCYLYNGVLYLFEYGFER
jgi:signal transduction histidine kinase